MKILAALLLGLGLYTSSLAQISTLVIQNKLVIPQNPQEEIIPITKDELGKVKWISSLLGEVQGYTILFKCTWNGEISLFTKKINNNTLDENIKKRLLEVPEGTHIYLDEVNIRIGKKKNKIMEVDKHYEFILVDK
jgi:hypothetical protein